MDIALAVGDIVEIDVAGVGVLTNTVEVIPERLK
jgi:2-dehydro-3-deoxy-D-arabinonate dehydratase